LGTFAEDKAGWYHVMDGEGYTYVLMANGSGNEATVTAEVPGAYAAPLGDFSVTFSNGVLSAQLPPDSAVAVKITDTPGRGVYKENVKRYTVGNGTVWAEENIWFALYQQYGTAWELIGLYQNGDTVREVTQGVYKFKILHWDRLTPEEDAEEWTDF